MPKRRPNPKKADDILAAIRARQECDEDSRVRLKHLKSTLASGNDEFETVSTSQRGDFEVNLSQLQEYPVSRTVGWTIELVLKQIETIGLEAFVEQLNSHSAFEKTVESLVWKHNRAMGLVYSWEQDPSK